MNFLESSPGAAVLEYCSAISATVKLCAAVLCCALSIRLSKGKSVLLFVFYMLSWCCCCVPVVLLLCCYCVVNVLFLCCYCVVVLLL